MKSFNNIILCSAIAMLLFTVFSIAGFAAPQLNSISINSTDIWLGNSISFSASCANATGVWAVLEPGDVNVDFSSPSNNSYTASFSPVFSGNYSGTIYCKNAQEIVNAALGSFNVKKLNINILSPSEQALKYQNDDLEIIVSAKKDSIVLINGLNFDVYLENSIQALLSKTFSNNTWILKIKVPSDYSGQYNLKVVGKYSEISLGNTTSYDEKSNVIAVNPPLLFSIESMESEKIVGGETIILHAKTFFKGIFLPNLTKDNFIVGSDFNILDSAKDKEEYLIKIGLPDYSPGAYNLNIKLTYGGKSVEQIKKIIYPIILTGNLLDSNLKPAEGKITFTKGFEVLTYKIAGKSTLQVPKGKYDITLWSPKLSAKFSGVNLDNNTENLINLAYLDSADINSIKLAAAFAMEFKLPFDNLDLDIAYDDSKISDETNIDVYTCRNWNFGAKKCNSAWEIMEGSFDTIGNKVRIKTNHLSAYVIGERSSITVILNTDKENYYLDEQIKINGIIKDPEGNPIEKAIVYTTISNITEKATTNKDGIYSVNMKAPKTEGSFDLVARIEKSLFTPTSIIKKITIYKKKDVVINAPERIDTTGTGISTKIFIVNSGQDEITNITLNTTGVPEGWITFDKNKIDSLKQGENAAIQLQINPKNATTDSHTFSINLVADGMSRSRTVNLVITDLTIVIENKSTVAPVTAMVTFDITNIDTVLIIVFVIIVVVLIIVLIKKRPKSRDSVLSMAKNLGDEIDIKKKRRS